MNKNFDNIPSEIFDWIQSTTFSQLDGKQQKKVETFFSPEEYQSMHFAANAVIRATQAPPTNTKGNSKAFLMERFDEQHAPKTRVILFQKPVFYWQAAAMLLLLLSAWLFYRVVEIQEPETNSIMATTDTVYVDREVKSQPEIIHDTVYRYKYTQEKNTGNWSESKTETIVKPALVKEEYYENIPAMDFKQLDNRANSLRRNSMKDDSLLKKYGFVSM